MKKKNLLFITGILLTIIILTACGSKDVKADGEFVIGINQFLEHPALDQVREGFEARIGELNLPITLEVKNAQGDIPNGTTISQKFIKDEVDLIFAIATPVAQSTKQATSDIPIIFSAVTDPVDSGLVKDFNRPGGNISGTSDESPIDRQLELFKSLDPSIKKIGIIYSTGEANSQIQIERAREIGKDLNLEIETIGITEISDIGQALDSIISRVDGIYTITDNKVASAINLVAKKARENNLITIGGEEAHVAGGILMTDGISYFELGRQSADMAKRILIDGENIGDISCEKSKTHTKVFNTETLEALGLSIDNPAFEGASPLK